MPTRLLFVASALATFVLIPSANAATYCVGTPTCDGIAEATLTDALAAADATPELDGIELGIGEYPGHWQNAPGRPVRITGSGPLTTIVPNDNLLAAMTITGAASTVSDLSVEVGPSNVSTTGLRLAGGARGERIRVTAADGASNGTGIELGTGSSLAQSTVSLGGGVPSMTGVTVAGDGATLSDVSITAAVGVHVLGDAVVRRTQIAAAAKGLAADGGTARVESTLLDVRDGGIEIDVTAKADVSHVTIVGANVPGRAGLRASGSASLSVRDSIVSGMPSAYSAGGQASVSLDHVVRDPAAKRIGAAADTNPITTAPQFAGLGTAPFALAAGSALVDTGSDTPLAQDESAWDLSGNARLTDGNGDCTARRDPGAYETAAGPACPAPTAPPEPPTPTATPDPPAAPQVPVTPADRTAPKLTKLKLTRAKLTFRLSEAGAMTVTVQRKSGRRYVTARTIKKTGRAGQVSVALRLRAGHYRVLVDVVDLAGNRVSVRRAL